MSHLDELERSTHKAAAAILNKALTTTDPIAFAALQSQLNTLAPNESLRVLVMVGEHLEAAKNHPADTALKLEAAQQSLTQAEAKRDADAAANASAVEKARQAVKIARQDHAVSQVHANRLHAARTGQAAEGFKLYSNKLIKAWLATQEGGDS